MMSLNIEAKKIKNPFPGLRPFETDEYRLFFGREGQASALISRLERSHFLAIVGTSGSGKSSLVRAGLLPALRGGLMAGAGSGWRIAIMRPGSDPIGNLAAALADKGVLSEAAGGLAPAEALAVIEATLRRGSLGLVDAARQARLGEHDKLLVVVDQFEELFRFRAARPASSSGDDASAFVKLLLEAAQQRELQIYIVPTMRSDFLGDCAQFQGLPEAINDGQYLIPRMTRDERRFAITGPVGVTRGKISEPLVNRLMNDVGDNPDQLPILQHALMRTWDYWAAHRRNGEPIGIEHYEAVGTMSDALSHHADEAFNELRDERSRLIAEKLFKALTERGADNREIRRPTCLKDICAIAEATAAEVVAVVDVFRGGGRSFLMPPAGVALEPDTVIDISHESLIRNWLRLKDWVNEEAQSARIYRRLAEAAVLHREGSEGLLQDPGLQIALDWRQKANPNAAWARRYHPEFDEALRYLDDSRAARDAAVAERERQREEQIARERRELEQAQLYAEQQRRAARRLRWLSVGMAVMFILALATAAVAMVTWRAAARDRDAASQARDAQAAARIETEESLAKLELTQAELVKKTDIAEASLRIAKKANEAAVIDREKAETEATRANKQAKIAAENFREAEVSRKEAVANAAQFKSAVERNTVIREGLEAVRRKEYEEALKHFEDLRKRFEVLQPGVTRTGQPSTPEESRQFVIDLAWTNSTLGATHRLMSEDEEAVTAFERALSILKDLTDRGDPIVKDHLMFETYSGLGHAYHQIGLTDEAKRGQGVKSKPAYEKAETYLKLALQIQERRAADDKTSQTGPVYSGAVHEDLEVAAALSDLARLYRDADKLPEAEKYFTRTAEYLKQKYAGGPNVVAALRDLAEFYRDQSRFDDAVRAYNELIDIQDRDVSFAEAGKLADTYGDLGQVHAALNNDEKADKTYEVANLLQQVALKYRKEQESLTNEAAVTGESKAVITIDDNLDELADAYVELGRYTQAEETYVTAMDLRNQFKANASKRWQSYEKLGDLFANQIKDQDYAQHHTEKAYAEAYKKAIDYYSMLVGFYEPSPTEPQKLEYLEALDKLGSLYAKEPDTYYGAEETFKKAIKVLDEKPRRATRYEMRKYETLSDLITLYKKQNKVAELEAAHLERLKVLGGFVSTTVTVRDARRSDSSKALSLYPGAISELSQFYSTHNRGSEATAVYARLLEVDKKWLPQITDQAVLTAYAQGYDALIASLTGQNRAAELNDALERSKIVKDKLSYIKSVAESAEKKE
jgi:hypothetical protein